MRVVHVVMSKDFAGIEQHVDELLSNNLVKEPMLICNVSIGSLYIEGNFSFINLLFIKCHSEIK